MPPRTGMPASDAAEDQLELRDSVFVLGTGRSGTTIFYRMLAAHPDLGWYSNYVDRFPSLPQLAVLSRLVESRGTGGPRDGWRRVLPTPKEALGVPRRITGNLFVRHELLADSDVAPEVVERYRAHALRVLRWQGKPRLLHKHTGFARTGFLRAVDPTGRFIHLVRDGRAVVNSLLGVDWWDGTLGSWWWGPMPEDMRERYERSGRDPLVLAGLVWLRLTELIEEETRALGPDEILTERYDRFVGDPGGVMARVCRFADLPDTPRFRERLARFQVRNEDLGWKRRLSTSQVETLNALLGPKLAHFGFEI